jgi:hypothetical protein
VAKEDVFAEDAIKEFHDLNSDPGIHIRQVQTDSDSHLPFGGCLLPGLNLAPSLKTCLTSTLANPSVTSNSASSATSPTNTGGSTPVSVGSRVASTITITEPMIIPETPYVPLEPPFRCYANTHDSIGCADPLVQKKWPTTENASPEPWGSPATLELETQSLPSPPTGPPSPEMNLMLLCDASLL